MTSSTAASKGLIFLCALSCLIAAPPVAAQTGRNKKAQRVLEDIGKAYKAKDWAEAIELGLEVDRLVPDHPIAQYNLACAYSLNGDVDNAAKWLGKAVESGFDELEKIESDPDLDRIRDHPGYRAALDAVKNHRVKVHAELESVFKERPPLVYVPLDYDDTVAVPLIIALHGYGGRADGYPLLWRDAAVDIGAILIAPQAVRSVKGAGYSWGDIKESDYLVQLTLEAALKQYKIDRQRVILTGFSQGGFIAYSLGVRHPEEFTGVIPMGAPYWPSVDAPAKVTGNRRKPRFYFMCGARDRLLKETRQAAKDFATAGYEVRLRVCPRVGHEFPLNRDVELLKAVRFVLAD